MPLTIPIPPIMRTLTGGAATVDAHGANLAEVIDNLDRQWPGVQQRLIHNEALVRFMNLYVNDQDARFSGGLRAPVSPGDVITILPAVAGGQLREPWPLG